MATLNAQHSWSWELMKSTKNCKLKVLCLVNKWKSVFIFKPNTVSCQYTIFCCDRINVYKAQISWQSCNSVMQFLCTVALNVVIYSEINLCYNVCPLCLPKKFTNELWIFWPIKYLPAIPGAAQTLLLNDKSDPWLWPKQVRARSRSYLKATQSSTIHSRDKRLNITFLVSK